MRNLARHAFLILAVIVAAIYAIVPPSEKLRLGKDLAGGTSLVYQVDIRPTDPSGTLSQVIDLVKRRVDPTGLMEISIEAQGNDRIEVTMPQPNAAAKALRKSFEDALSQLAQGNIDAAAFDRIVAKPDAERQAELDKLAAGDADRTRLLAEAATLYDAARAAEAAFNADLARREAAIADLRRQLEDGQRAARPKDELDAITAAIAAAETELAESAATVARADRAYEVRRNEALSTTISVVELRRALELPKNDRRYRDEAGTLQVLDSPRSRALKRLKDRYPSAAQRLDAVVGEYDKYQAKRKTLDDPDDLRRLLRGAGVLSFRITVNPGELGEEQTLRADLRDKGPRAIRSSAYRWFKVNKEDAWFDDVKQQNALFADPAGYFANRGYVVETFDGQYWMLCHDTRGKRLTQAEGAWTLAAARAGTDELGRPSISFEMDALGGEKMAQLTEANVGSQMAVILDDEIYTAPNIQSKIGNRGQITGTFTDEEIKYVVRVLSAGSLAAKLTPEPISQSQISPELGVENLKAGLRAGVIAFVAIGAFMIFYYFICGAVSVIALFLNALVVLAAMAAQYAAFSLPAIAGVILTFGMAIDANVLIYERIREELSHGEDLKTAIRMGFARALSSIVDGHMTVLIVCVVLGIVGTQEIKGFAITMSVGAVATLFTQLYATRFVFSLLVDKFGLPKLSMLPLAIPAIQRLFHLNVDWMKYRVVFFGISAILTVASATTLVVRGSDILDTEFKGGSKVTIQLKETAPGQRMTMARQDVAERMNALADEASRSTDPEQRTLLSLRDPRVRVVNPVDPIGTGKGAISSTFELKTDIQDANILKSALTRRFADVMDVLEPLDFAGRRAEIKEAPVFPILSDQLAEVGNLGVAMKIPEFVGGAAVVIDQLDPRPTLASLEARLKDIKTKPDYTEASARPMRWVRLAGTDAAVEKAVLLVRDDTVNYLTDQSAWSANLRNPSWSMVKDALGQTTSTLSVESFSASVAATFKARAFVAVLLSSLAIIIYIWVRFASIRYSLAAIATSLHDCLVAVGLIALGEVIYSSMPGVAHTLGILPFKVDLNVIASVLAILGYSLNDTIIVMDRIREKRGKLPYASRAIINKAVNDTISRTIITGGTTMLAAFTLYLFGGEAVRAFAFAFIVGIGVGTYSSIAVAAPIVWVRRADPHGEETPNPFGASAQSGVMLPPGTSQTNGLPAGQPNKLT